MTKTAADFRSASNKALEALAEGLLPRLRPILDEVGAVSSYNMTVLSATFCYKHMHVYHSVQCMTTVYDMFVWSICIELIHPLQWSPTLFWYP